MDGMHRCVNALRELWTCGSVPKSYEELCKLYFDVSNWLQRMEVTELPNIVDVDLADKFGWREST